MCPTGRELWHCLPLVKVFHVGSRQGDFMLGRDALPVGWYLMTMKARRWLARASFALMLAAVALLLAVAGWRSLALVVFAVVGVCAVLAGGYWFLANRGVLRWIALVLVVAAPVFILVAFACTTWCGSLSWRWR